MALIEIQDVTFGYRGGREVLKNISMKVERGTRTAILGANGAGKTTLFYTMTGVNKPNSGTVLYDGSPVQYTRKGLEELRSHTAVVLQNPDEQIFCSIVEEDVAFGPLNLGMERDEVEGRVDRALAAVRMTEYRKRPLQQLSGGQRKRVAIAGALAVEPEVMIMDEPTAGLDPQSAMEVMELAERLVLQGVTVMISTHDVNLAYGWADTADVINGGRIRFCGTQDDFYSDRKVAYECGLLEPSAFKINREACSMRGIGMAPFTHTDGEVAAKFGKKGNGRVLCVPCRPGEEADIFDSVRKDVKDDVAGIYGPETRAALAGKDVEYVYDGIDRCLAVAASGKDSVLFYDPVFAPTLARAAERMRTFVPDIRTEEVQ